MTTIARLEKLTWPVIYIGLFLAIVGAALWRNDEPSGLAVVAVGGIVTLVGAALVWWRSRLDGTADV